MEGLAASGGYEQGKPAMFSVRPRVQLDVDGVTVDAKIVGEGLGVDAACVPEMMRSGEITSVFERGVDSDNGRIRLTFWYQQHRFRVVIDDVGTIVQRLRIDYGQKRPR